MSDPSKKTSLFKKLYHRYTAASLDSLHLVLLFFSAFLFLAGRAVKIPGCRQAGFWLAFCTIVSYLFHYNQKKFYAFIRLNEKTACLPERQMKLVNHLFLGLFLTFSGSFMLLLTKLPYQKIIDIIGGFFRSAAAAVLAFLYREPEPSSVGSPVTEIVIPQISDGTLAAAGPDFSPLIKTILIVLVLFSAFVFANVLFYLMYYRLSERNKNADQKEFILPSGKKEKLRADNSPVFQKHVSDNSINEKVRRLYRKLIIFRIKKQKEEVKPPKAFPHAFTLAKVQTEIPQSLTPSEIEDYVKLETNDYHSLLHTFYEQARYSREGCTKEQLEQLKNNNKRKK